MNDKAAPWVGLFVVAGLVLLSVMTFLVDDEGKISFRKKAGSQYTITFEDAGGLLKGAQVFRDGVKVGKVTQVKLVGVEGPQATVEMTPGNYIYKNDAIQLRVASLIAGGQNIHLVTKRTDPGDKCQDGAVLPGASSSTLTGVLDSVNGFFSGAKEMVETFKGDYTAQVKPALANINDITKEVKEGGGTLHKLVYEKDLYDTANEGVKSLVNTAKEIETGKGTLHNIIYEDQLYTDVKNLITDIKEPVKKVDETMAEAKKFMVNLNEGEGVITKLSYDKNWSMSVSGTLTDLRKASDVLYLVFQRVNEGNGAVSKLINDENLSKKISNVIDYLETTSKNASDVVKDIQEGKGTIGRLVKKTDLYEEAQNLLGEIRGAVEDSREFVPVSSALSVVFGTAR